ncbi:MAG: hypothetical protein ACJ0Q9_00535, partial [Gammaproteobacteria bacterium]
VPYAFAVASVYCRNDRISLIKFFLLHFIPMITVVLYYYSYTWDSINEYYYFVGRELDKPLADRVLGLVWILKNVPGFLFSGQTNTLVTYFFSCVWQILFLVTACWSTKTLWKIRTVKGHLGRELWFLIILSVSSLVLFYGSILGTAFLMGDLYTLPGHQYSQPFVVTALSLISLSLVIIFKLYLFRQQGIGCVKRANWPCIFILILATFFAPLTYNVAFNFSKLNSEPANPTPQMAKRARAILDIARSHTEEVALTTYTNSVNYALYNYYNIQQRKLRIPHYGGVIPFALAAVPDPRSQYSEQLFTEHMRRLVVDTDAIVVPEYFEGYQDPGLVFSDYRDVIRKVIQEPRLRYEVVGIINEARIVNKRRLFVLKKVAPWKAVSNDSLVLFPEKYPTKANPFRFDESKVLSDLRNDDISDSESSRMPRHENPRRLIDNDNGSFWEEKGVQQVVLVTLFDEMLDSYKLMPAPYGSESIARMPISWIIETSLDGLTWELLESFVAESDPQKPSIHAFPERQHGPYYRFTFKPGETGIIRIGEFLPIVEKTSKKPDVMIFRCAPAVMIGEACSVNNRSIDITDG